MYNAATHLKISTHSGLLNTQYVPFTLTHLTGSSCHTCTRNRLQLSYVCTTGAVYKYKCTPCRPRFHVHACWSSLNCINRSHITSTYNRRCCAYVINWISSRYKLAVKTSQHRYLCNNAYCFDTVKTKFRVQYCNVCNHCMIQATLMRPKRLGSFYCATTKFSEMFGKDILII